MDKTSRPAQSVRQDMQPARQTLHPQAASHPGGLRGVVNNKRSKRRLTIAVAIMLVLLLSLAGYFMIKQFSTVQPDKNAYQAVFLSDGQVYFGKLDNVNSNYVQMSNIYYLQANQKLQTESSKPKDSKTVKQDAGDMKLIKLGDELHGPTDKMQIKNSQVLFWEDLKQDSKVSKAIKNYVKQ